MRPFSLNVVLVRTIYDSNIGASSRAMANMGAHRLILIDPQCEVTYSAQQAAASGQEGLQNRTVYPHWQSFHESEREGIRIAFTAKDGKARQVRDFEEVLQWIKKEDPEMQSESAAPMPIYLIFGPEDWGLSNFDLELSHFNACIPTFGKNPSLNLSQAVLLALFQLRLHWGGERTVLEGQQKKRKPRDENAIFPEKTLALYLNEMGFPNSDRKVSTYSVMKRMLLHNIPSKKELKILETVLQQGLRKLREYNQLRIRFGLPAISATIQNKQPSKTEYCSTAKTDALDELRLSEK